MTATANAIVIAFLTGAAAGLWLGFKLWRQTYVKIDCLTDGRGWRPK